MAETSLIFLRCWFLWCSVNSAHCLIHTKHTFEKLPLKLCLQHWKP